MDGMGRDKEYSLGSYFKIFFSHGLHSKPSGVIDNLEIRVGMRAGYGIYLMYVELNISDIEKALSKEKGYPPVLEF